VWYCTIGLCPPRYADQDRLGEWVDTCISDLWRITSSVIYQQKSDFGSGFACEFICVYIQASFSKTRKALSTCYSSKEPLLNGSIWCLYDKGWPLTFLWPIQNAIIYIMYRRSYIYSCHQLFRKTGFPQHDGHALYIRDSWFLPHFYKHTVHIKGKALVYKYIYIYYTVMQINNICIKTNKSINHLIKYY